VDDHPVLVYIVYLKRIRSANGLCAYVTVGYHETGVRWGLFAVFRATHSSKLLGVIVDCEMKNPEGTKFLIFNYVNIQPA